VKTQNRVRAGLDILPLAMPSQVTVASVRSGINLLIASSWLSLYWPVLVWLAGMLKRPDTRLNLVLLLPAAAQLLAQLTRGIRTGRLSTCAAPRLAWPVLTLTLAASSAYVVAENRLGVHILSASLFGLATYGLVSLYFANRGLPAALLLIAGLPFGSYLDVYVGFPVRFMTANVVHELLAALRITSEPIATILVLENGIAHIDLPCSGVQSLWTGLLFYLAAACHRHPSLDRRWIAVGSLMAISLMLANALRVFILVVVALVLRRPHVAEVLHVPLGIVGFAACCATALTLLRSSPVSDTPLADRATPPKAAWLLQAFLLAAIVSLGFAYRPPMPSPGGGAPFTVELPSSVTSSTMPFSAEEREFFDLHGPVRAQRLRFRWQELSGSLLLSLSPSWRGHHNPEHCLAGNGRRVSASHTLLAAPDFPLRTATLDDGQSTAAYWFQAPTRTTDEIASRIWADLTGRESRWMLVSVVFDGSVDPSAPQPRAFLTLIHTAVTAAWKGELK
jgi:exosortase O